MRFHFESTVPLLDELVTGEETTYIYPVTIFALAVNEIRAGVPSEVKALVGVLGWSRRIVDEAMLRLKDVRHILLPLTIYVDRVVDEVVAEGDYLITFLHARTPTSGDLLRSVSLYGDDIGTSDLFHIARNSLNCFICGLRTPSGRSELVRLGGDGLFATMDVPQRLQAVATAIEYVRRLGFMRF
jgi:hypothetical protein